MSSERKKEKRENIKREKERKNFLGKNGFFCLFSGFSGEISFFFLSTIFFCFLSSRRKSFPVQLFRLQTEIIFAIQHKN